MKGGKRGGSGELKNRGASRQGGPSRKAPVVPARGQPANGCAALGMTPRLGEAIRNEAQSGEEEENAVHPGSQSKRGPNANPGRNGAFLRGTEKNH